MATRAVRVRPVLFQALTQRSGLIEIALFFKGWDVRRWRWWRCPEDLLEHPLSANDRCRPGGSRGCEQYASKRQHAASQRTARELNTTEMITFHPIDLVVPRKLLVQEREVRFEQVKNAPVF